MPEQIPCPHCGADIDATANFCRHCGSSDADGWREDFDNDIDDDFDYEQFVEENFPEHTTNTQTRTLWRFIALILLLAFAFFLYNIRTRLF